MNKKVKYIKVTIIIAILLMLIVSDCSPRFKAAYHHDDMNPCSELYKETFQDTLECYTWKMKYPKEYQRYLKRTTVDSIR